MSALVLSPQEFLANEMSLCYPNCPLRPNPKVLFLIERARILRQYGDEFSDELVAQKIGGERTLGGVPGTCWRMAILVEQY